jgi:enoyl-CoA hydratase
VLYADPASPALAGDARTDPRSRRAGRLGGRSGVRDRRATVSGMDGCAKEGTMAYENLLYESKDGVAHVIVNRPKVMNALNSATLAELRSACLEAREDAGVKGVIVTGAGDKAFVAGADIAELSKLAPLAAKEFSATGQQTFDAIEGLGKPVIAAVNGFALGGGCELAMACTLRVASSNARFGQPEVNLGIIPGFAGTQRLARLVGKGIALELVMTGNMIDAQEAHRIGLVNKVVEPGHAVEEAENMMATILSKGPIAVRFAMEAVHKGLNMSFAEGCNLEASLFGLVCASGDVKEGLSAFLEKRTPDFKNC